MTASRIRKCGKSVYRKFKALVKPWNVSLFKGFISQKWCPNVKAALLDIPLCNITVVVIRRYQLVRHSQLSDLVLVGLGYFVVLHLVRRGDALLFHSSQTVVFASIIYSSDLFFITSTHVEAPSISCMIIW